ncbi:synaptotagmin 15a [Lottia gigantea]|uniref:Synaptotagmin 15a n=1 Tax=Lottia gigantea TaxID=225164 RepID=V4AE70_LOTGI|nr:synaptotagmin 15a [Lottia gigantea]ESO93415.1 synaptotagmin 15a [Lottia gigantea]
MRIISRRLVRTSGHGEEMDHGKKDHGHRDHGEEDHGHRDNGEEDRGHRDRDETNHGHRNHHDKHHEVRDHGKRGDDNSGYKTTYAAQEINAEEGVSNPSAKHNDYIFGNITVTSLGIIVGCSAAVLLIIILAIVIFKIRRKRRKFDLQFEDLNEDTLFSRSCPSSRSSSPKLAKRRSCPDAYASFKPRDSVLIRSMTIERIPDFELPPERVQPKVSYDRSLSIGPTTYQQCIGSIQPELYRHPTVPEEDEDDLPPTEHGRLWFSIIYDVAVEQLCVNLIKVKNIPGRGVNHAPRDPFVKIYLLPDERTCRTSKTRKKSLSPVYNESFTFQVSPDEILTRTLRFSVYDVDKRQIRHSLGHVMVAMKDVDLTRGEVIWSDLEPMAQAASSLGDIQVSLTYIPQQEKIKIVVMRARNLRPSDYTSESGLYARVQFYYGRRAHKTKKTTMQRIHSDPEIHESFTFSIAGKQLDTCNVVLSIITSQTRGPFSREEEYGRVTVGPFMFARGEELIHWQEMVAQSKTPITRWHTLTPYVAPDLH